MSNTNIPDEFTEIYEGGKGIRFKIKDVSINGKGNIFTTDKGGKVTVALSLFHNCTDCGTSVNQVIVGLAGEDRAQVTIWNGFQFSGGDPKIIEGGEKLSAGESNTAPEWVKVQFQLTIPDRKGEYYIRARYAQDYAGNLATEAGRKIEQTIHEEPLKWWKVDRPAGPDAKSNIGLVIVE